MFYLPNLLLPRLQPPESINTFEEIITNLHALLPLRLNEQSLSISEYLEYLVDDSQSLLSSSTILEFTELEQVVLPSFYVGRVNRLVQFFYRLTNATFGLLVWPFVLIFLLGLKLSAIRR